MQMDCDHILNRIHQIILGHEHEVRLALACLLAQGHLLIEDRPGMGKTTLAQVLAKVLGLKFSRIQFTSDLLPSDVIGASMFKRANEKFVFKPGPIFAPLVLADEINRASAKSQSALLEAMEERQVSCDGRTFGLPEPFFVIATQNPNDEVGTSKLPASQLDRFMVRLSLGYPNRHIESELLSGIDRRQMIRTLEPCLDLSRLVELQKQVDQVHVSQSVLNYALDLLHQSRIHPKLDFGLSPRAGQALVKMAKSWAALAKRQYVVPHDIKAVFKSVVSHRLPAHTFDLDSIIDDLLNQTPIAPERDHAVNMSS